MRSSLVLNALFALLTTTFAHNINLGAHSRECFHEVLHKDDKMTVTFQVGDREFGGAGNLEIDFWVGGWVGGDSYEDDATSSNFFYKRFMLTYLLLFLLDC